MTLGLLDLPVEVRLDIYTHVFGKGTATFMNGPQTEPPTFMPAQSGIQTSCPRSAQLLRTCRTIFNEAESILYTNTDFCTIAEAFAGKLPTLVSDDKAVGSKVKNLKWQLKCDMMKHFYPEDLQIEAKDLLQLVNLELRCQAENWRQPSCGVWCDQDSFIQGYEEIIGYARSLREQMRQAGQGEVYLTEDQSQLGRGRVILHMQRRTPVLREKVR